MVRQEQSPNNSQREQLTIEGVLENVQTRFLDRAISGDTTRGSLVNIIKIYGEHRSAQNHLNHATNLEVPDQGVAAWLVDVVTGSKDFDRIVARRARDMFRLETIDTSDRKPGHLLRRRNGIPLTREEWQNARTVCDRVSRIQWESPTPGRGPNR